MATNMRKRHLITPRHTESVCDERGPCMAASNALFDIARTTPPRPGDAIANDGSSDVEEISTLAPKGWGLHYTQYYDCKLQSFVWVGVAWVGVSVFSPVTEGDTELTTRTFP